MSDKQLILNTVSNIEDTKTYEEILYTLIMQLEIQKGIKDMENGNMKTTEELKEIIKNGKMDFEIVLKRLKKGLK